MIVMSLYKELIDAVTGNKFVDENEENMSISKETFNGVQKEINEVYERTQKLGKN